MFADAVGPSAAGPIGVFDSGYGGLTILHDMRLLLPQYDYLYLGDNARSPYGNRSFEVVYEYTRQAVRALFDRGCRLIILACNTASAKALRSIQQCDLPTIAPDRRVLGIIRPTAEMIGNVTRSRHVGILATEGTVLSRSYDLEIAKFFPDITVTSQACPLWAALVEAGEAESAGADYFVEKELTTLLNRDKEIDTILLGCTHYPLLMSKLVHHLAALRPKLTHDVNVLAQGKIVARALENYLERHPELAAACTTNGTCTYLTTESTDRFACSARTFIADLADNLHLERIVLD